MKKVVIKLSLLYGLVMVFNGKDNRTLSYLSYLISLYIKEIKLSKHSLNLIYDIMDEVEKFTKIKEIKPDLSLIYNYIVLLAEDCLSLTNETTKRNWKKRIIFERLIENSMKHFNSDLLELDKVEIFNKEVDLIINKI